MKGVKFASPEYLATLARCLGPDDCLLARGDENHTPTLNEVVQVWEGRKGKVKYVREDSWEYRQDEAEAILGDMFRASPGAAAKAVLESCALPRWYEQKYRPGNEVIPRIRKAITGGIVAMKRTFIASAVMLDMRQAYAWAIQQPLPAGPCHTIRESAIEATRWLLESDCEGMVFCTVETACQTLPFVDEYGMTWPVGRFEYSGTILELRRALLDDEVKIIGYADIVLWDVSSEYGRVVEAIDGYPPWLQKMLYTRLWPRFSNGGGWSARRERVDDSDRPDGEVPGLWWHYDSPDRERVYRTIDMPWVVAYITALVRERLWEMARHLDGAHVLTDAVILPAASSWQGLVGNDRGQMKVVCQGSYFGIAPGQYAIIGEGVERIKLSGIAGRVDRETLRRTAKMAFPDEWRLGQDEALRTKGKYIASKNGEGFGKSRGYTTDTVIGWWPIVDYGEW